MEPNALLSDPDLEVDVGLVEAGRVIPLPAGMIEGSPLGRATSLKHQRESEGKESESTRLASKIES